MNKFTLNFSAHLNKLSFAEHNEYTYILGDKNSVSSFKPDQITVKNKIFFVIVKIHNGVLYHWVHFYGSPIEAKNYSYTLEYYNDTKTPKITCSFTDQVVSIDETIKSIFEKVNCLSFSRKLFENKFLQKNDVFKFSVKIRNLKEEVKDENVESGFSDVDE